MTGENKLKVVILAGGYGTRLSEETELRPKPMVEIGGRPILWHIMKIYSHYGFNDFIVCCGYKSYYRAFMQTPPYQAGDRIPYAARVFDEQEMVNLADSTLEFWLTAGCYAEQFEKGLAGYLKIPHCSLVNSGSSANLLAFMVLTSPLLGDRAIHRGDEVITVAAGFPTTVTLMLQYGAIPVFVDVTIPQYNIDVSQLERAWSPKTKAMMLAHTLGTPLTCKR
jgi:CDP-6-deoxy-D-xylo-4-hexulose-3-dehydrase